MMSQSPVRANVATNTIIWVTATVAALLVLVWFMTHNPFDAYTSVDKMDEDLFQLGQMIGHACTTLDYSGRYNPVTETGTIEVQDDELCMSEHEEPLPENLKRCVGLPCGTRVSTSITLNNITYVTIQKNASFTIGQI